MGEERGTAGGCVGSRKGWQVGRHSWDWVGRQSERMDAQVDEWVIVNESIAILYPCYGKALPLLWYGKAMAISMARPCHGRDNGHAMA